MYIYKGSALPITYGVVHMENQTTRVVGFDIQAYSIEKSGALLFLCLYCTHRQQYIRPRG